jgi:RNA polymerase sigma factor for flagellar operon FliA
MTKLTLERDSRVGDGSQPASAPMMFSTSCLPGSSTKQMSDYELWECYTRGGAQDQRDRLVLHYEPLVRQVAGRVGTRLPAHVELADLIQAGVFGLIDAIDRFEPDLGVRFESYAAQRIRGAILDELRAQDWVPRVVRNRARELDKAREAVEARLQRRATAAELAAELGVGPAEVRGILNQIQVISMEALDEWAAMRGGTISVAETLAQDDSDPVAILEAKETSDLLQRCLARLPERDRHVLRLYYAENLTLAEIGRRLGVTESRVSQLRSRAVTRLRGHFAELAGSSIQLN